jgi:hypothetical protein
MQHNGWDHALKVTADGTGLVGHAGAVLLRKAADQTGLTAWLSGALRKKGTSPLFDRGIVLVSLAAAIALDATSMSDITLLAHLAPVLGGRAERPDSAPRPLWGSRKYARSAGPCWTTFTPACRSAATSRSSASRSPGSAFSVDEHQGLGRAPPVDHALTWVSWPVLPKRVAGTCRAATAHPWQRRILVRNGRPPFKTRAIRSVRAKEHVMSKAKHAGRPRQIRIRRARQWAKRRTHYVVPAAQILASVAAWIEVFRHR